MDVSNPIFLILQPAVNVLPQMSHQIIADIKHHRYHNIYLAIQLI